MSLELIWTSQLCFLFSDHLANKLMPYEIKYVHLIIPMCNYFLFGCQLISSWNWGNYSLENTYYAFLKISLSIYKQTGTGWRGFLQNLSCSKIKWRLRIVFWVCFQVPYHSCCILPHLYIFLYCGRKSPFAPYWRLIKLQWNFIQYDSCCRWNVNHEIVSEHTMKQLC